MNFNTNFANQLSVLVVHGSVKAIIEKFGYEDAKALEIAGYIQEHFRAGWHG